MFCLYFYIVATKSVPLQLVVGYMYTMDTSCVLGPVMTAELHFDSYISGYICSQHCVLKNISMPWTQTQCHISRPRTQLWYPCSFSPSQSSWYHSKHKVLTYSVSMLVQRGKRFTDSSVHAWSWGRGRFCGNWSTTTYKEMVKINRCWDSWLTDVLGAPNRRQWQLLVEANNMSRRHCARSERREPNNEPEPVLAKHLVLSVTWQSAVHYNTSSAPWHQTCVHC